MSTKIPNATRSDIHNIRHDNDAIEIRMIEDPAHPDYDPRVELPVDPELMASLRMVGQLEPASGYQEELADGAKVVYLLFGRQRWKAIQQIWQEMRENGEDMAFAPSFRLCLQRNESSALKRQKRIIENRHRQGLEGLALAREVSAHLNIVGESAQSLEDARVIFNFKSIAALRNCLSLLQTTPKVHEKIIDGTISPTAALQLSRQSAAIQDAVVDEIDEQEDADLAEPAPLPQIDAFREDEPPPAPSKPSKPVPVSDIKGMIKDKKGEQSFEMVNLKQVEKQIERKEAELEKAMTKLEMCPTSPYDQGYQKTVNQAGKVAEIQGEIKALRWCRGETVASGSDAASAGNDKVSAAWDALREALTSAAWPKILVGDDFEWPDFPKWIDGDAINNAKVHAAREVRVEINEKIEASHFLVIAGEKVARRDVTSSGYTYNIQIDSDSKWFTRLMDPFGKSAQLVRDWGAHGYLEPQGKSAITPTYRMNCGNLCKGRTAIQIRKGAFLDKWIEGTTLEYGSNESKVSATIRSIISKVIPTRHINFKCEFFESFLYEGTGPDLEETLEDRQQILSAIAEELGIGWPDEACTWNTVGDLIASAERFGEEDID